MSKKEKKKLLKLLKKYEKRYLKYVKLYENPYIVFQKKLLSFYEYKLDYLEEEIERIHIKLSGE